MSFLRRALQLEKRDIQFPSTQGSDLFTSTSVAGVSVTQEKALNFIAVYACVSLLSDDIASLPLDTFVRVKGERRELKAPAWLEAPNREQLTFEFIQHVMSSLLLWGNAYVLTIRDDQGQVVELWVLDPSTVRVERDRTTRALTYRVTGASEPLTADDVLHVRGLCSPASPLGLSPIAVGRSAIAAGIAADTYAASFWANGAQPSSLLTTKDNLDDEDIERISAAWSKMHSGAAKAHKTAVLPGGIEYKALAIPAEDSQFLETRQFQVAEIARLFRVPPHMIGDLERSTFSNIEHQSIDYVTHTLRPWLTRLENALSSLLPAGQYVKFNEAALLRGDMKSQSESFKIAIENGWMNIDEVRQKLDLKPLEAGAGETHYRPLNLGPVGEKPEVTLEEKTQAVSRLVSAGFEPQSALVAVGLPPIEHTGHIPSTLLPEQALPETDGDSTDD